MGSNLFTQHFEQCGSTITCEDQLEVLQQVSGSALAATHAWVSVKHDAQDAVN